MMFLSKTSMAIFYVSSSCITLGLVQPTCWVGSNVGKMLSFGTVKYFLWITVELLVKQKP